MPFGSQGIRWILTSKTKINSSWVMRLETWDYLQVVYNQWCWQNTLNTEYTHYQDLIKPYRTIEKYNNQFKANNYETDTNCYTCVLDDNLQHVIRSRKKESN